MTKLLTQEFVDDLFYSDKCVIIIIIIIVIIIIFTTITLSLFGIIEARRSLLKMV